LAALGAACDQKRKRQHRCGMKEIAARALGHALSPSRLPRSVRSTFPRGCADPEAFADRP
jgi:hypothetical protein